MSKAEAKSPNAANAGSAGLRIGASNDPMELEADRIASQVLSGDRQASAGRVAPSIQRASTDGGAEAAQVPDSVHQTLASAGQAMDPVVQQDMEQRFGYDFSNVRVHTDGAAAQSAHDVQALAYTVGSDLVFAPGRYAPSTSDGLHLLAHELTHVIQQSGARSVQRLQRQCDPAWANLPWSDQVTNAKAAAAGAASNRCLASMIDGALTANVTVDEATNSSPTLDAAIAAGKYTEWGTLSDLHINFDRNLGRKTGDPSQYGETRFKTVADDSTFKIYIVLGPAALNTIGPQYTRMAAQHEGEHAQDFLMQWAMRGSTPHGATPGEELAIYAEGFSHYFLDLWNIDNTGNGSATIADNFSRLFSNFALATPAERTSALASISMFYDVRIVGIPCNMMKFKVWLQMRQNALPAFDALVAGINALPGLGLTRGDSPADHFDTTLACS